MHDHRRLYRQITRPLPFHRILQNIYWKCHYHRRSYRRIQFVGISQRVAKYLLEMPQLPTTLQIDTVHRHLLAVHNYR